MDRIIELDKHFSLALWIEYRGFRYIGTIGYTHTHIIKCHVVTHIVVGSHVVTHAVLVGHVVTHMSRDGSRDEHKDCIEAAYVHSYIYYI